jgi:hypothetical protein
VPLSGQGAIEQAETASVPDIANIADIPCETHPHPTNDKTGAELTSDSCSEVQSG